MTVTSSVDPDLFYPESDGKPMADNTKQFRWIVTIKENLEIWYANRADVFVAGDLLWYPVEGDNKTRQAPDAMVVFGRPKGDRGSYQQWKEDNLPPQVVFEILSPGNTTREMDGKREFYERYEVEEYYVYDPDRLKFFGWTRQKGRFVPIASPEGWVSPRLGIRFTKVNGDLEIYRPDGQKFLTPVELDQQMQQERQRAEEERQRAEEERQRAEEARERAEQAEAQVRQIVQNLLQSRVEVAQIAAMTGLSFEQIQAIQELL
jgi:Uma2 family endonuclease